MFKFFVADLLKKSEMSCVKKIILRQNNCFKQSFKKEQQTYKLLKFFFDLIENNICHQQPIEIWKNI